MNKMYIAEQVHNKLYNVRIMGKKVTARCSERFIMKNAVNPSITTKHGKKIIRFMAE